MKRFHVRVRNSCALLMHKFSASASADLSATVKKRSSGPPAAADEAESVAYRLDANDGQKGQLCLPTEHFFQAMVLAASGFQVRGQGKKTYKDAVKGNIFIEPDYVGLSNTKGEKLFDYKIDTRPARVKTARINRSRPLIAEWVAEFDLVIGDENAVGGEVANAILVNAGQTRGVGDYHPRFGRFIVERFEEVKG